MMIENSYIVVFIVFALWGWCAFLLSAWHLKVRQDYIDFLHESRDYWKELCVALAQQRIDDGEEWKNG